MMELEELEKLLITEISKIYLFPNIDFEYYNEVLGDTSIYLSSIITDHILDNERWEKEKWIDDALLTQCRVEKNIIQLWGILIWGRLDVGQEWIDPFYFQIVLNENRSNFYNYSFLVGELNMDEITYEEFNQNRSTTEKDSYYNTSKWNPSNRKWDYTIFHLNPQFNISESINV